jgi:hypothetical protein
MITVPKHPAEFSPGVLTVLAELIRPGEHVHDPYAGRGLRLGALCDQIGAAFTGTDIERYQDTDPRVVEADAGDPLAYPPPPFTITTSPPYLNGISSDYKQGPTPQTVLDGRRAYGISLGRPLHQNNLARLVVRSRREHPQFWARVATHVGHWGQRVLFNVDLPMLDAATVMLEARGYRITGVIPASTGRYRNGANRELRAEHEVVIEAVRT